MNRKKEKVIAKAKYIEEQLEVLDRYLPETYQYLMAELDLQRRLLVEIELSEMFK